MPTARRLHALALLAALSLVTACRPHPQPTTATTRLTPATRPTTSPSTRPKTRPAILDIRRGTGSFPLAGTAPLDSAAVLADSLRDAYLARIIPADRDRLITVAGTLPSLDLLRIDVSGARFRDDFRPSNFDKSAKAERTLTAYRLEYIADPLSYDAASARLSLTADDATLDLMRDAKETRGLVLQGARNGRMEFHASAKDLNRMMTFAPRAGGKASNLTVLRTTISFANTDGDPRALDLTLDLRARWVLLPLTLTLRGHLAASPDGDITFSDLDATGYDPGGLLAAAFLNPSLHKMNGQSQPLLSFPDPATHVTDVRFATDDGFTVTIDFGK